MLFTVSFKDTNKLFFVDNTGILGLQQQEKIKSSNCGKSTKSESLDLWLITKVMLMMSVELLLCEKVIFWFLLEKIKPSKYGLFVM